MGCCEARDKRGSYRDYKDDENIEKSKQPIVPALVPNVPHELHIFDSKFSEIESYALYLSETTLDWVIDCSDAAYIIKHLSVPFTQTSSYCSISRCSYYFVNFNRPIAHQLLIDVMEKESIRKQWDSKVKEIKIQRNEDGSRLVMSKFAKLMFNRTLVEKRITKSERDEDRVVYYTPGNLDAQDTSKAFTYFGLHRYITTEGKTTMLLFSQTDFRMPEIVKKAVAQIKGESEKWLKACHNQILEIV